MTRNDSVHEGPTIGGGLTRRQGLLVLGMILLVCAAAYLPGVHGGFVFDDYPNIVDNVDLHVTQGKADWIKAALSSPSSDLQRPLAMLSFAANHYFTGLAPGPMKATNIFIHLLNVVLVYALAATLCRALPAAQAPEPAQRRVVAAFVAAAWALAPINLMAVLYAVQRMESLCHLFVFAGLLLYVAGRLRQRAGAAGMALIGLGIVGGIGLGVLSKESAVLLPVYAFSLEFTLFRFRSAGAIDKRIVLTFVLVLLLPALVGMIWLLPRMLDPSAWVSRDFTLTERLLTEAHVLWDYFRWIVLPDLGTLSLYHDDYPIARDGLSSPGTLAAVAGLATLVFASVWLSARRPLCAVGLQWFVAAHLLTATVIPLELVFEHRNYFASLGLFLAVADLLLLAPQAPQLRRSATVLAAGLLLFWGATTALRVREWSDPIRFAVSEAEKHPLSARATYDRAQAWIAITGFHADAATTPQVFEALASARAAPRGSILPEHATLVFAARSGVPLKPEWWRSLQDKLAGHAPGPQDISALAAMTNCVLENLCRFPVDEMLRSFGLALSHQPSGKLLSVYANYVLNVLGDSALALRLLEDAIALEPKESEHRVGMARVLIALNRFDAAQAQIDELRRLGRFGQYRDKAELLEQRLAAQRKKVLLHD